MAYIVQDKPKGWDMSIVQRFCCKGFSHFAVNCSKTFYNYWKNNGHIIKECLTQPPKKFEMAHTASVDSSNVNGFVVTTSMTQNASSFV